MKKVLKACVYIGGEEARGGTATARGARAGTGREVTGTRMARRVRACVERDCGDPAEGRGLAERTQVTGHMLYVHCRSFWHCGSSSLWSYLHWCHEL